MANVPKGMSEQKTDPRVLVVVPARNEERTVGGVVMNIRHHVNWDILVVDDFSGDSTAEEARKAGADVVSLCFHLGAWGAIQTGFRFAVDECYDIVVTMDADGQHSAQYLKNLVSTVTDQNADLAIGVCLGRASIIRNFAWRMFRRISGLSLKDLTSGFRAYHQRAAIVLLSREASMLTYQDIGVLMLLKNSRMSIVETEVNMFLRMTGISKIYPSWTAIWTYVTQTVLLCVSKISMPWSDKNKYE